jgi:hypothetical protein
MWNHMKRRQLVAGVAGIAGIAGGIVGTGAFSTVSSQRRVTVNIAADSSALLSLSPQNYAEIAGNGSLNVAFEAPSQGADGVNDDAAAMTFSNLFEVKNQGTQPALVWIEDDVSWLTFLDGSGGSIEGRSNGLLLDPGGDASDPDDPLAVGARIEAVDGTVKSNTFSARLRAVINPGGTS